MDRPLGPLPNWKVRWIVFGVLILPALFTPYLSWFSKLFAVAMVASLVGSARDSRVIGTELVTQLFIAFITKNRNAAS